MSPAETIDSALRQPLCRAPFVTMEFVASGDVQACCANVLYPLGNVAESTLSEIWMGQRVRQLRTALTEGDRSLGCMVCRHREENNGAERPLEAYAGFPLPEAQPGWPYRLSFSLLNTCNLECVMCNPALSSRIRSRRAKLPPLPDRYGPEFFEQLGPFLDHCELVDFVGGEPFLVRGHHVVWDMLAERDLTPRCAITTNGTVWNARVEQVLERLDTDVRVSIDGVSAAIFEHIRRGASHAEVLRNLDRFRSYARERGTEIAINWTFVRQNWFELGEMMQWAEERGLRVYVMTATEPDFAVQLMDTPELEVVAATMADQAEALVPQLSLNRDPWIRQVDMVVAELTRRRGGEPSAPLLRMAAGSDVEELAGRITALALSGNAASAAQADARRGEALAQEARWMLGHPGAGPPAPIGSVIVNVDGTIINSALDAVVTCWPTGAPSTIAEAIERLATVFGGRLWVADVVLEADRVTATVYVGGTEKDRSAIVFRLTAYPHTDGAEVIVARDDWFAPQTSPSADGVRVEFGVPRRPPG